MRELQSLLRVPHHNHIVQLYEVHRSHHGIVSFVMEYMTQGTLLDLMESHSHSSSSAGDTKHSSNHEMHAVVASPKTTATTNTSNSTVPLPHRIVRHLVHQILLGVQHLHANHIYHRDLKPENILLGPNYFCKIADFSLARTYDETKLPTSYVSTRWYRAPEQLLRSTHYTSPVDLWAIGCIASELYTCEPLFPGRDECDQLNRIFTALGTPSMVQWKEGTQLLQSLNIKSWQNPPVNVPNVSPRTFMIQTLSSNNNFSKDEVERTVVVEFLLSLLALDPAQRSDTSTALRHKYFTDNVFPTSFADGHPAIQEPCTTIHSNDDDKENTEKLRKRSNDRPSLGHKNDQPTTGAILSSRNPYHTNASNALPHRSVVHNKNDPPPTPKAAQLPLLHKSNPYKKDRIR